MTERDKELDRDEAVSVVLDLVKRAVER
jgi:hypothetical protein